MHHRNGLSRRDTLRHLGALGTLAAVGPIGSALAQAQSLALTPKQTEGPFYPDAKPLDQDADLTVLQGRSGRAEGQVIHVMGRILNRSGEPVRGARVEVWQANTHGRYAHSADINPAPLDPNFQGFGVQLTDKEGRYRFKTIKPGAYPINPMNPGSVRTPHIHFDVKGTSDHLVTQMYFPNESGNETDVIYRWLGASQEAATARMLPPSAEYEPDSLVVLWDVVLAKG